MSEGCRVFSPGVEEGTVCAEISAVCKFRGHILVQRKFNP